MSALTGGETMRPPIVCLGVLVVAVLSACGAEPETETASESPNLSPCPSSADPPDDALPSSRCVSGAPGQSGGGSAASAGGGPDGSITRRWSESVTQSGGGTSGVVTQQYMAVVEVSLSNVGDGGWTISGPASISSTYTSDYRNNQTSSLGPCNVHYTDNASASDTVAVEGGLEARDGFYNFYVNIPGADGSNATVRDDSGCNGPNKQETTPWSAAAITVSGSGDMTDARTISGGSSTPRENGEDTVTWTFTLPE
jgi:hypothetical protein